LIFAALPGVARGDNAGGGKFVDSFADGLDASGKTIKPQFEKIRRISHSNRALQIDA
jgi:hypothetical protein